VTSSADRPPIRRSRPPSRADSPTRSRAAEPIGFRLYDFAVRAGGLNLAMIGVLLASILAVAYRSGDRWAWFVMWLLPAWALAVPVLVVSFGTAPGTTLPPPAISGPILALVAALALLIDRRRFVESRVAQLWLEPRPA
jgi:hypothetical protein